MTSLVRLSPALGLVCFFSLGGGCGHVGLETRVDDQESVSVTGGSNGGDGDGDVTGDGDGDGETGGVGGTGGLGSGGMGTGGQGTGGRSLFGGFGGLGGSLGIFEEPENPCSLACEDPVLLYETFEDGLPEVIQVAGGGTVDLNEELSTFGDNAFSAAQGGADSFAKITQQIPRVVGGQLYLRAWVFVPEDATISELRLFSFNGVDSPGLQFILHADGSLEVFFAGSGTSAFSLESAIPRGEWVCLRSRTFVDNVNGEVDIWVNDRRAASAQGWDTFPGAEIHSISYGILDTASETGAAVLLDEIAAARVPIPCEL